MLAFVSFVNKNMRFVFSNSLPCRKNTTHFVILLIN